MTTKKNLLIFLKFIFYFHQYQYGRVPRGQNPLTDCEFFTKVILGRVLASGPWSFTGNYLFGASVILIFIDCIGPFNLQDLKDVHRI